VAASRWTEFPGRVGRELVRELRGLRGNERLAVVGVAVILGSLPLPWYDFTGGLVKTGLGAFSFAEGAILLTCAAVVFLSLQVGGGYAPPRPLTEWGLFVAAGIWIALIVGYRMFDRPAQEFDLALIEVTRDYGLGYGIFVALGGAALIVAAGVRSRVSSSRSRSRRSPSPAP
jgi:hypothetical protein